jgi:hypothetical protein
MTEDILEQLFDELFPICRSITGEGIRRSLAIFQRHMPLEIETVPSGTTVFDWTVPPEWNIRSAKLTAPDGRVVNGTFNPPVAQKTSGRIWRGVDWRPEHLSLIYDVYGDRIVDKYLDGEFMKRDPKLVRGVR